MAKTYSAPAYSHGLNASNYTGELTPIAIGRILHDRKETEKIKDQLNDIDEIFFKWNTSKVEPDYIQLIIGPSDTPYEGAFMFFQGVFPNNYPFIPMTMEALTQGDGVRSHPNFYTSGKCCFSFLGTWQGPPWTSCQSMLSIANTIKSVMTKFAIQNEPGWEKSTDQRAIMYDTIIHYWNIKCAVLDNMEKPPRGCEVFQEIMEKKFIKYYFQHLKNLDYVQEQVIKVNDKNQNLKSPMWGFSIYVDYEKTKERLNNMYDSLIKKYSTLKPIGVPIVSEILLEVKIPTKNEELLNEVEPVVEPKLEEDPIQINEQTKEEVKEEFKEDTKSEETKKGTRKAPSKPAKNYEVGFQMKSENDGKMYVVKGYDNGQKRWVLSK
jgi:ubiquitin-protein ligase